MNVSYICIKELDYGIENEVIHVGDIYQFEKSYGNRTFIKCSGKIIEIYDWALKEYFREVV